jgi:hypothetical protein
VFSMRVFQRTCLVSKAEKKIVYIYSKLGRCVSSRMTKFPPCTRPGRFSATRNTCVFIRLQLELYSHKVCQ